MFSLFALESGGLQDAVTIFLAIIIEATPFIVLGVIVSLLIKTFVNEERLIKVLPKNPFISHLLMACFGMIFPVCECGNVPLLRQLLSKNIPVSSAISFYLGAPILNIAVIASTAAAFGTTSVVFWARLIIGFLIAYLVGLYVHFFTVNSHSLLTNSMKLQCEHDHSDQKGLKFLMSADALKFFHREIRSMFLLLVLGAGIASINQVWISREILLSFNSSPLLAILAMMLLAVVISVCSTVDAFIALGFSQSFSPGALLGFLVYGPMIDIKAISMLSTTLNFRFLARIVILVTLLTLIFSLIITTIGF